jgi:hypothetical protein
MKPQPPLTKDEAQVLLMMERAEKAATTLELEHKISGPECNVMPAELRQTIRNALIDAWLEGRMSILQDMQKAQKERAARIRR